MDLQNNFRINGIATRKAEDKFAETGHASVKSERVNAPYIKAFPLKVERKMVRVLDLGLHPQFIGELKNAAAFAKGAAAQG